MRATIIKLLSLTLFVGLFLATTVSGVPAENNWSYNYSNGKVTLATDNIAIEITGQANTPMFFFWDPSDVDTTYKIQFIKVFEVIDDGDGVYTSNDQNVVNSQLALAKYTWEFSDFVTDMENDSVTAVHLNITSLPDTNGMVEDLPVIQFNNHLYADDPSAIKFDVVIDNYTWHDPSAMLVLGYTIVLPDNRLNQTGNQIQFGEAYFQAQTQAQANGSNIDVGLSYGDGDNGTMLYLSYEHFDGLMVHDPTIGLSSVVVTDPTNTEDPTDTTPTDGKTETDRVSSNPPVLPDMSNVNLFQTSVIAVSIALMVPVVAYYRRK